MLTCRFHFLFVGVTGKYLLQVYPKADVWQRTHQEKFIAELRTWMPTPPARRCSFTNEKLLKDSYIQAAWYSLAAIALWFCSIFAASAR